MNSPSKQTPWDTLYESYLEIEAGGASFPIDNAFLPQSDSRVLDLGCGVGTHMRVFLTRTNNVVGIDLSLPMARAAARVAPVAQANLLALPFRNSSFDYLWSGVVISCVPNWNLAFDEALRVVQPGGTLILLVSNRWSVMTPFRWIISRLGVYSEGFIQHLSRGDFESYSGKARFKIRNLFAVQKPARSRNPFFLIGAKVFYKLDRVIATFLPWWGGDLCVIIERLP